MSLQQAKHDDVVKSAARCYAACTHVVGVRRQRVILQPITLELTGVSRATWNVINDSGQRTEEIVLYSLVCQSVDLQARKSCRQILTPFSVWITYETGANWFKFVHRTTHGPAGVASLMGSTRRTRLAASKTLKGSELVSPVNRWDVFVRHCRMTGVFVTE